MPDYDPEYLEFYDDYPRKEGKADGAKAWRGLSKGDRAAARADVAKRIRMGAYSSNKKLIQLPASYLRARRWEDDWQSTLESTRKPETISLGRPHPAPIQLNELPWKERLLGRLGLSYMMTAAAKGVTLPDTDKALAIKQQILRDTRDFTETPREQSEIIGPLFMDHMDAAYGVKIGKAALERARRLRR